MITFETIYDKEPKTVKSFIKKLFEEEIKAVGPIKILDFEDRNLICKLGNQKVVIDFCDITINGEPVFDKSISLLKFVAENFDGNLTDAILDRREKILDNKIEKYTMNTQRILLELHKLSKNPIEKDVTSIGELHQKYPKLVEDFVKKLYAKEIKEAGQDMEFLYDDSMLECKLDGNWVIVDDSAYYETDFQSKGFQVARFLAKMCGQKYIDYAMETNLDIFQTVVKEHNNLTQLLLQTANEVFENTRKRKTEYKVL